MRIFAIADLHLSNSSNKPMDIFGENWTNHMNVLFENWIKIVDDQDVVLIPGDISWGMRLDEAKADLDRLEKLPGQKICIRGNHDYWWDRPGKLNKLYETLYFLQNKAYCIGKIGICGSRGWTCPNGLTDHEADGKILDRELIRLKLSLEDALNKNAQQIIVMMHYPPANREDPTSPFTLLFQKYPIVHVVYGHLHDAESWQGALQGLCGGIQYHLVAADYLGFSPLLIGERLTF
ncbi:MAG: metallophosphoesterase [Clostridia bacterium]|jgi:predicted phosphohydrolase|nr:metallophosphoesterase [Clostridia bacterium]